MIENAYERIFADWNKESRNNKMNVYIGVGGYGCQCITEMTVGKSDIRILIDKDELLLDSTHVTIRSDATYRALDVNSETDVGQWNKYVIKFSPSREEISGKIMDIICKAARDNEMEINIIIFSTMCGNFGSHNAIEIGKRLESALSARHYTAQAVFVFLPVVNVGGVYAHLNNNLCNFIEKCNTNQELRWFLFEKDNVKAFVIYPDAAPEREFVHLHYSFVSDIKTILNHIHTREYIGEKEYKESVIWEHNSCFVERLEKWLISAVRRYSMPLQGQSNKDIVKNIKHIADFDINEKYIFISYAHIDSTKVLPIIQKLQTEGYCVWYDDGIDPGTEWDENIAVHVDNCAYFIAMVSNNYLQSENCKDELNYARDLGKNRLLVYLEECTLPSGMAMRLNRLQSIFAYRYPSKDDFYKKLFTAKDIESCKFKKTFGDSSDEPFSIFQLLKINDIKELDIAYLRKSKDIASSSLYVPIGKFENGQVAIVDLTVDSNGLIVAKDRYEIKNVIYTYLLSLATLYGPNEMQLHMIDFEVSHTELQRLPHFKKSLMKCDEKSVKEYISYMANEIISRKDLFKHNKVSSIYQYNQLQKSQKNVKTLPHIMITVNDIRKLKVEQPEYFQKMMGLSKDSNLLGIHWLFCTDDFFGLVDDKMYNTTGFKLFSAHHESPAEQIFNGIIDENLRFYLQTPSIQSPKPLIVANSNIHFSSNFNASDTNAVTPSVNHYESQQTLIIKEIIKFDASNFQ